MDREFEVEVKTSRLKLSPADLKAYKDLGRYDWILFSSKNTAAYLVEDMKKNVISLPAGPRIAAIGKVTAAVLKRNGMRINAMPKKATAKSLVGSLGLIRGKRILFPRSAVAADDVLKIMRKKGAKVRAIPIYTSEPVLLSQREKVEILTGKYKAFKFKSPSGIRGLLGQFNRKDKRTVLLLNADCIGPTTSLAARKAGFRQVRDLSI